MRRRATTTRRGTLCALLLLTGCFSPSGGGDGASGAPDSPEGDRLPAGERAFRERYDATPLGITGAVVDVAGRPVPGARVTIAGRSAATETDGRFAIDGLARANGLLTVEADGHHAEHVAVHGTVPIDRDTVAVGTVVLVPRAAGSTRFLFGGDVSFGRRFLNPAGDTPFDRIPPDHPDALIRASDPAPGSIGAVRFVRPLFRAADYPVVNLESPVTDRPDTPHPEKDFVFFTLPGSLAALTDPGLGLPYVGLGNNHLYDYLDPGVADTRRFLGEARIAFSGAGLDAEQAAAPHRMTAAGVRYGLLAFSSVSGTRFDIDYLASDAKGGSASLLDLDDVSARIGAELDDGRYPIVQLHTGQEYTFAPTDFAASRLRGAAEAGAALVIAHHPHVAQGFERHAGVLIVQSLGNFVFDQERLETMLGMLAQVDLRERTVRFARALPVYLEDFRPRPVTAPLAERFLRRVGEVSGASDVLVYPHAARGWVSGDPGDSVVEGRATSLDVTIPERGFAVVDLRGVAAPDESLRSVTLDATGVGVHIGRDLLDFGDFEDVDVDEDRFELSRWDVSSEDRFPCLEHPHRGAVALCLLRDASNRDDTVAALRNRVRVRGDAENLPRKELTLVGYARGDGAGALTIVARYQASEGDALFGEERALELAPGSYDWTPFAEDLSMPADDPAAPEDATANPRALRLFVRHAPPAAGEGLASVDELAIVSWEEEIDATGATPLATPHARDFLRLEGPPGPYRLELRFRRYRPAVTAP